MVGVGEHGAHLLPNGVGIVAKADTVSKALAHLLLAIGARQATRCLVLGKHDIGLHKHITIGAVEATHQLAGDFNHGLLVLTCGNDVGLKERDVGSLTHRVAEEA